MNLHGKIMNIKSSGSILSQERDPLIAYKNGHCDARHAAAELANEADALIAELLAALQAVLPYVQCGDALVVRAAIAKATQ